MESHNAPAPPAADTPLERALRLSGYARRVLAADPGAGDGAGIERPFTARISPAART